MPLFFAFAAVSVALLPFAGCVAALLVVDTLPGGLPAACFGILSSAAGAIK